MQIAEKETPILVYGTNWCPDCVRVRKFLDAHHIEYRWFNINEDPRACAFVEKTNHGYQSVPTIVWPDGSYLVEPSLMQLSSKLELNE
jgi:mycoredoxin